MITGFMQRLAMIGGAGLVALAMLPAAAHAKNGGTATESSSACAGGGFTVSGFTNGATLGTSGLKTTAQASVIGAKLVVTGKFSTFEIDGASFAVRNYVFTGVADPDDLTGGHRTLIWQERTPDHRGLVLNGAMTVEIDGNSLVLTRAGTGLSMQIQAKDCPSGGVFQMEVERADGAATTFTHVLTPGVFYFDNPNFRAREGDVVPYKTTTVAVAARINIGNDVSRLFLARDSAQDATRVNDPTCPNPIVTRSGAVTIVQACGRVSHWSVLSGGRMGFVTGEDATEVAPPAVPCAHQCQAQDQVRGQSLVLGAPFPVPTAMRLKPELP